MPSDPADPERRLALNETAHRRVNEALERGREGEVLHVRCECGHLGCSELLELTREEHEAVRTGFERFLLLREHLEPPDRVVEDHGSYVVAEKQGAGARVARLEDPRPDADADVDGVGGSRR